MKLPQNKTSRLEVFIDNPSKALWTLAFPIMAGMGIHTLYTIVDMIFIGRLGGDAIAAVAFNMPLFFLVLGLSFGIANNGPLTELGTIREYINYVKPKIILWVFHPNDLYDIKREIKKPILKDYFKENFYQNLVNRQNEIDFFLKNIMDSSKNGIKSKSKAFFITLKRNIRSHLTLHNLRYFLNISSMSNNYELFEKIITLAEENPSSNSNIRVMTCKLIDASDIKQYQKTLQTMVRNLARSDTGKNETA